MEKCVTETTLDMGNLLLAIEQAETLRMRRETGREYRVTVTLAGALETHAAAPTGKM